MKRLPVSLCSLLLWWIMPVLPESVDLRISVDRKYTGLRDLVTGEEIASQTGGGSQAGGFGGFGTGGGIRTIFPVTLKPHSYRVFSAAQAH